MGLDMRLEWIEYVGDIIPRRDILRILGFWKRRELRFDCRSTQLRFSDQIWSDQVSLGFNQQRWVGILVLYFGLRPGQKCHSKVMHQKEVTHSNGSYERKSRGWKLADEMGPGKKKFPWYTHRLMHWKRITCELHDSYFRLMTIKHAISKIE